MDSVLELVGVDRITLPPTILEKLASTNQQLEVKLSEEKAKSLDLTKISLDEKTFRWEMNGKYLSF